MRIGWLTLVGVSVALGACGGTTILASGTGGGGAGGDIAGGAGAAGRLAAGGENGAGTDAGGTAPTAGRSSGGTAGEGTSGASNGGAAGATPMTGCVAISEEALNGCRAADEPNCARCCVQTEADVCTEWNTPCTQSNDRPGADYCGTVSLPGKCPTDCRKCASCSKYSESALCSLMPTIGSCDCANLPIGVDPCFAPGSCACLCNVYQVALNACPS